MSGMCPWCRLTDRPTSVTIDQIACKHPWHGRSPEDKPAIATPPSPSEPLVASAFPPIPDLLPIVPDASDAVWAEATLLNAPELTQSVERNSTALLLEVAEHAFHGLDLAMFAAAQNEPARRGGRVVELAALKAKLEDWVVANR